MCNKQKKHYTYHYLLSTELFVCCTIAVCWFVLPFNNQKTLPKLTLFTIYIVSKLNNFICNV